MSKYEVHVNYNEKLKMMLASIKKDGTIFKETMMDVPSWAEPKLYQKLIVKTCQEFIERDKRNGTQSEGNE